MKENAGIPVIGNGDVFSPEDFKRRLDESGVDYILVARGAIGKPYLFKQINDYLSHGEYQALTNTQQLDCYDEYLEIASKHAVPFQQVKIHAQSFTTGQTGAARFRGDLTRTRTMDQLRAALSEYRAFVSKNER